VSWLEDFADGEAVWHRLMAAPTFDAFLDAADQLSAWELQKIVLYHGIAEKQASGEWRTWAGDAPS
jgi:hypothetical protein